MENENKIQEIIKELTANITHHKDLDHSKFNQDMMIELLLSSFIEEEMNERKKNRKTTNTVSST